MNKNTEPTFKVSSFVVDAKGTDIVLEPITDEIRKRNYYKVIISQKLRFNVRLKDFRVVMASALIESKHGEVVQPLKTIEGTDLDTVINETRAWIAENLYGLEKVTA